MVLLNQQYIVSFAAAHLAAVPRLDVHKPCCCDSHSHDQHTILSVFTYVDGRLLLVSGEDPDLDFGPHQSGDGLGHAGLETVLYGRGAQQQ